MYAHTRVRTHTVGEMFAMGASSSSCSGVKGLQFFSQYSSSLREDNKRHASQSVYMGQCLSQRVHMLGGGEGGGGGREGVDGGRC